MSVNKLLQVFDINQDSDALIWNGEAYKYKCLIRSVNKWEAILINMNIGSGTVVSLLGNFSPNSIAIMIALIKRKCIIALLSLKNKSMKDEYCHIAQAEYLIEVSSTDEVIFSQLVNRCDSSLLQQLKTEAKPGLVIFSSGSTGNAKAAVHNFEPILERLSKPRRKSRVIGFLLFDHIGGINTLFYTLFNAGCFIALNNRTPQSVCSAIENFKAESLTTTPTFLNLLLLSGVIDQYDLSSLSIINYGTEVMNASTLAKLNETFDQVRFSQSYGLSEVGVLSARSISSNSLFIQLQGDGFETRVVDGLLEVKSECSMMGYLNAESPFTKDGWFKTGDAVEVSGNTIRVLGRQSELINVGGEKVYPAEVENIIQLFDGVEQVSVFSESNAIIGQIVVAKIKLRASESPEQFRSRLVEFCKSKLSTYKIPQKIILTNEILHNERFKKIRLKVA